MKGVLFTKVCNGVNDCPDGEDEDSQLWDLSVDRPYAKQTHNWSLSHNNQCFQDSHNNCSMDILLVILIFSVIMVIILALVMASIFKLFPFINVILFYSGAG